MYRLPVVIVSILVWWAVVGLSAGTACGQSSPPGPAPDIRVSLALDKVTYYPGDPILVTLAAENRGGEEVVGKGFFDDASLQLQFFDEAGTIITAEQFNTTDPFVPPPNTLMPPPPRVFPDEESGVLVQGAIVEILTSGAVVGFDPFDAHTYYPLANRSGDFRARAVVPNRTFFSYLQASTGILYAPTFPTDQTKWAGSHVSNFVSFTLVGDWDQDGYYYPEPHGAQPQVDCDDANPEVSPGTAEIPGNGIDDDCNPATPDEEVAPSVVPGLIQVKIDKHTVGGGRGQGSTKAPCVGVLVRAYDKASGSCVRRFGVSSHHYQNIWLSCSAPNGAATTDGGGVAQVKVEPGNYLVIAAYDPDGALNYDGDELYLGVSVGQVHSGKTKVKYLQVMENAKEKTSSKKQK